MTQAAVEQSRNNFFTEIIPRDQRVRAQFNSSAGAALVAD
jgi:hypothetical protein